MAGKKNKKTKGDALPTREEIIRRRLAEIEENNTEEESPVKEKTASKTDKEFDELQDKYLRLMAEYRNYQNRTIRDREKSLNISLKSIMLDVVQNLDHLEMALESAEKDQNIDALCQGIRMTEMEIIRSLEKYGLKRIQTEGEYFDPDYHEAVMMEDHDELNDEMVIDEFKAGYKLGDIVIRPAMVRVARNPEKPMPDEIKEQRRKAKAKKNGSETEPADTDESPAAERTS